MESYEQPSCKALYGFKFKSSENRDYVLLQMVFEPVPVSPFKVYFMVMNENSPFHNRNLSAYRRISNMN